MAISQEDADSAKLQNKRKGIRNPQTSLVSFVIFGIKIKNDGLNWSFLLTLGGRIKVFTPYLDANGAIHGSSAIQGQWWGLEVNKK